MKRKYGFVAVLLVVILLCSMVLTNAYVKNEQASDAEEVTIVTSFYPMYIAAMNIVGDTKGVSLQNLSEPQTGCLHDYQMTPADMKLLSTADIFIVNGGGIESFLADVAANYPNLTIINACEDVTLLGTDEHAHDGHAHGSGNAHAWMSVADYMVQVETITEGLTQADGAHAKAYEAGAEAYLQKLAPLAKEIEELKASIDAESVVSFHESYEYVAKDLGLSVAFTLNLDEERQVSAGEVAEVIGLIRQDGITVVLAEEQYGTDMGNNVEKETAAKVVYLDTLVTGDYEKDSYINGMETNIRLLKEAFAP